MQVRQYVARRLLKLPLVLFAVTVIVFGLSRVGGNPIAIYLEHDFSQEQVAIFMELANVEGGGPLDWAEKAEDRNRLWQARHDAYWAGLGMRPGAKAFVTDVCVPLSRLADCIAKTMVDIEAAKLIATVMGHVGDGNFHVMVMFDMENHEEIAAVETFNHRLVERALQMGGTCTGEHGVGSGKIKFLGKEHGPALVTMTAIKKALDPDNILNPGKIIALP